MTRDIPIDAGRAEQRIPVSILTGYLGSGKTTLLNCALKRPEMAHTAVIINEYGEVAIDHDLTAASDDTIRILDNGCLCCTVFGDLVGVLQQLFHDRASGKLPHFERIVVETSGLAHPGPVLQAFLSDPAIEALYRVETLVAVFDAVNGPHTLAQCNDAVRQLALADQVVVTKFDLVDTKTEAESRRALEARILALNPAASIRFSDGPEFDAAELLAHGFADPSINAESALGWLPVEAYQAGTSNDHNHCDFPEHGPDCHAHGEGIASYCLVRETPSSRAALNLLLEAIGQNLGPSLLRVKGFVNVAEVPDRPAVIQGAQHLLHNVSFLDAWPSSDRRTRLVFITQDIAPHDLEDMVTLLDRVASRTAAARDAAQSVKR